MLSSCQTIRAEIMSIIWRLHPIILQPLVKGCVSFALEWPVRQLVTEVRFEKECEDPTLHALFEVDMPLDEPDDICRDSCAMSLEDCQAVVLSAAGHPALDQIEIVMDLSTLSDLASCTGYARCPQHTTNLLQSSPLKLFRKNIYQLEHSGGFLHFRVHFSTRAAARSRACIAEHFPDIASVQNYQRGECKDHDAGLCKRITCRLLHAIQEMYGDEPDSDKLGPYITFDGYDREDDSSYVYEAAETMMPLVLDAPYMDEPGGELRTIHSPASEWITIDYDWPKFAYEFRYGQYYSVPLVRERFTRQEFLGVPIQTQVPAESHRSIYQINT